MAQSLLTAAGVRQHFERLLSVQDAGAWKPAARSYAYAYALEQGQVDPMDATLVAVHPWDTDGARRAGLSSAWINRGSAQYPSYVLPPNVGVRLARRPGGATPLTEAASYSTHVPSGDTLLQNTVSSASRINMPGSLNTGASPLLAVHRVEGEADVRCTPWYLLQPVRAGMSGWLARSHRSSGARRAGTRSRTMPPPAPQQLR